MTKTCSKCGGSRFNSCNGNCWDCHQRYKEASKIQRDLWKKGIDSRYGLNYYGLDKTDE